MSNSLLWICLIVSIMGNFVLGYLFWRAVKTDCELIWGYGNDAEGKNH